MTPKLTQISQELADQVENLFPDWLKYAAFFNPECGTEDDSRSLCLQVPSPSDSQCWLSIVDRCDCIEVAFSDGQPPGPAEKQFGDCRDGFHKACVENALQFVKEIVADEVVVVRERRPWLLGGGSTGTGFTTTNELNDDQHKITRIRSWQGSLSWDEI
jgi:hypothetical protein